MMMPTERTQTYDPLLAIYARLIEAALKARREAQELEDKLLVIGADGRETQEMLMCANEEVDTQFASCGE